MSEDVDTTSPRERSTYSSFSDDYRGFDAREDESGGKGLLVAALAIGVVLVFGTVVWNAYRAGVKKDASDTPVLRAGSGDFKHRPDETGGIETPNKDKRLFDVIDENHRDTEKVQAAQGSTVVSQQNTGPKDLRPGQPEHDASPAVEDPTPATKPIVKPEPKPAPTPPPERVYEEPTLPLVSFDQSGNYLVQLMALRDVASAEKAWSQMVEAYPELFAGAMMDIQRADLGAKGIFYRLRVSAFASRTGAESFCESLKARSENCIVATR